MDVYESQGFRFLYAIDSFQGGNLTDCRAIGTWVTTNGHSGLSLDDNPGDVFNAYRVYGSPPSTGIPQTSFIDRQGRVRYHEVGFGVSSGRAFETHIQELLAK